MRDEQCRRKKKKNRNDGKNYTKIHTTTLVAVTAFAIASFVCFIRLVGCIVVATSPRRDINVIRHA